MAEGRCSIGDESGSVGVTAGLLAAVVKERYELVTLRRPAKRNAINRDMAAALLKLFGSSAPRSSKPIVLEGEGTSFCSGIDLDDPDSASLSDLFGQVLAAMDRCNRPIVCLCHGAVLGAGLQLVLGADVVFATPESVFGMPHAKLGRMPRPEHIRRLTGRVPVGLARYMLLTGESIGVSRFLAAGIVVEVAEQSVLRRRVDEVCSALSASDSGLASALKAQLTAHAVDR